MNHSKHEKLVRVEMSFTAYAELLKTFFDPAGKHKACRADVVDYLNKTGGYLGTVVDVVIG